MSTFGLDLDASHAVLLVLVLWVQWVAPCVPLLRSNTHLRLPFRQKGSRCPTPSVVGQGERVAPNYERGPGRKCPNGPCLPWLREEVREAFGASCLQLIVEVR